MSKPISVGDLVVVVRPTLCCKLEVSLGMYFTVLGGPRHSLCSCGNCGHTKPNVGTVTLDNGNACEIERLKRVPPLEELGQLTTEQWMKENAA